MPFFFCWHNPRIAFCTVLKKHSRRRQLLWKAEGFLPRGASPSSPALSSRRFSALWSELKSSAKSRVLSKRRGSSCGSPAGCRPCSARCPAGAAHGGETWGTRTVTVSTQGHSLCSAHKALHKGHKAGDEERAVTPARAPRSRSPAPPGSWAGKAGQLHGGQ